MLMLRLLDFLYLDGYRSLMDKYADVSRETYRAERHWAYDNYREYFSRAFMHGDFRTCLIMRKLKKAGDYKRLYNIMIDTDGDIDNQIPVVD